MTYDEGGVSWPTHSDTTRAIEHIGHWAIWGTTGGRNLCKGELFVGSAFYGWCTDEDNCTTIGDSIRVPYSEYIGGASWSNRGDLPADARSKAIHTRDNGFGGVFIWELGYDLSADNSQSLLKAINDVMPSFSGPTIVCNSATRFQYNNRPVGVTVSWSFSQNLVGASGWGKCLYSSPCIYLRAANASAGGTGWVQATISGGPCGDVVLPKHDVWVGTPLKPTFMSGFLNDGKYFAFASPYEFLTSSPTNQEVNYYDWQVFNGTIESGQGTDHIIVLTANEMDAITLPGIPPDFNVSVRRENTCGTSPWFERTGFLDGDAMPQEDELKLAISPNPASSNITISEVLRSNESNPWHLRLMNQQGTILVETTSSLPNSISLQGLLPGAYVLHAIQGQYVEQQVVLVK